jgi:hypothetical protein
VIDGSAVAPQIVNIERNQDFVRARLPSGRTLEGTLRYVTEHLDYFVESCARADEAGAVSLPAALLASPDGRRVLFAGGRKSGKTTLALGLLSAGWTFEGDARVFIGADGVAAHPRTLRVPLSLVWRHSSFADLLDGAPSLAIDGLETTGDGDGALSPAKSMPSSFSKTPIRCIPPYAAPVQTKHLAALFSFSPRSYPSRRGMFRCSAPFSPLPSCFIWNWELLMAPSVVSSKPWRPSD